MSNKRYVRELSININKTIYIYVYSSLYNFHAFKLHIFMRNNILMPLKINNKKKTIIIVAFLKAGRKC